MFSSAGVNKEWRSQIAVNVTCPARGSHALRPPTPAEADGGRCAARYIDPYLLQHHAVRGSEFLYCVALGNSPSVQNKSFDVLLLGFVFLHLTTSTMSDRDYGSGIEEDDDKRLESLGYVPSFKREFSNLATVRTSRIHLSLSLFYLTQRRLALRLASWHVFLFTCVVTVILSPL